jgi:hypothetical protein
MIGITVLTILFTITLSVAMIFTQMDTISKNFNQYKDNPFVIFASPLLKPANDKRTRMEFATDAMKDAIQSQGSKTFGMFMKPVFDILNAFGSTINTLLNSLMGIRKLFENFFKGMLRIIQPFQRRFELTVAQLRKTFIELNNSISKVGGVATGAVYAGISMIQTMLNMFELMKSVSIAILVILVAMVFWFWFILWPIIPLIVIAISMLASSGSGESVSGMASAFCFDPKTLIKLSDNSSKPINEIKINDILYNNTVVQGILEIDSDSCKESFYNYKNIVVSGSHIVYENEETDESDKKQIPVFVKDSKYSIKLSESPKQMYCLITSTRKIPVVSNIDGTESIVDFADWEEYAEEDIDDLYEWNKKVFDILNNKETSYTKPNLQTIKSESAVAYETFIHTQFGKQKIHTIKPGTFVYDENNTLTKVLGVVKIDPKTITGFYPISISSSSAISNASWIKSIHSPHYTQISTNSLTKDDLFVPSSVSKNFWHSETKYKDYLLRGYDNHPWYNLITESGSFTVCDVKLPNKSTPINISMRDFTDVGHTKIDETYDFTMDCLRKFHSTN